MLTRTSGAKRIVKAAETLVRELYEAELCVYPSSGHLIVDSSLDDYDESAADLLKERVLAFPELAG